MREQQRALVCAPSTAVDHGLRMNDRGVVDVALAMRQHEAYCRALEGLGYALITMQSDSRYPDSVFVEDPGIILKDALIVTRLRRDFELLQTNDILRIRDEQIVKEHELNRVKSEFVSLASHQLKTPLTIIKWYIDMLNAGYAGESPASAKALAGKLEKHFDFIQGKQKEYLGIIYRNAERMIELIDVFLNVSRLELGIFPTKKEPVNLRDKMELILKNFEPKIKEKSLKLLRNYANGNFVFATDTKMIQIIFENLVSNAIKYTPHGGEVQIKMQKKGNEILIGVVDTGIGIPADQQSKIFGKFFRADNASSYKADGSGLGLYIAKTAVEKIGGKIWFRSPVVANKKGESGGKKEYRGTAFYAAF